MSQMWSLPLGWSSKWSDSKQKWYYWKDKGPPQWTPPEWENEIVMAYTGATPRDEFAAFRHCQNFCKSVAIALLLPSGSLLDVGCGKGGDASKVPPTSDYLGFDLTPHSIETAKKRHPTRDFCVASFLSPTLKEELGIKFPFDAAMSMFAFHYAGQSMPAALAAVRSCLKPGAQFLIVSLDLQQCQAHRTGFGPMAFTKWESLDDLHRVWVKMEGSVESLPEVLITPALLASPHFTIKQSELLSHYVCKHLDWSTEEPRKCDVVRQIKAFYSDSDSWDAQHWEFASLYRLWLLEAV